MKIDPGIKRIISVLLNITVLSIILFLSAGTIHIPRFWIYIGIGLIFLVINGILMYKYNPELIKVRGGIKKGTKTWDKILMTIYLLLSISFPLIAGLDIGRYHWSHLNVYYMLLGIIVYVSGSIITSWAMISNKYFDTTVRIQEERDHRVVTQGPYKKVRHPGYVGIILLNISGPFILGSLYSLIPAGLTVILFIIRTYLEDNTLQKELPGYLSYTKIVKSRLFPGLW